MKGVVQKAKAAGQDLKCTSCHTDTKTFQLTEDAPKKLSEWL
jgi:cytochrome c